MGRFISSVIRDRDESQLIFYLVRSHTHASHLRTVVQASESVCYFKSMSRTWWDFLDLAERIITVSEIPENFSLHDHRSRRRSWKKSSGGVMKSRKSEYKISTVIVLCAAVSDPKISFRAWNNSRVEPKPTFCNSRRLIDCTIFSETLVWCHSSLDQH